MDKQRLAQIKSEFLNKATDLKVLSELKEFFHKDEVRQPSSSPKSLEKALELEGVSQKYKMPYGLSDDEFNHMAQPFYLLSCAEDYAINPCAPFPEGISAPTKEYLLEIYDEHTSDAKGVMSDLQELNPELKEIKICKERAHTIMKDLAGFVESTTSGYPFSCIKHFSEATQSKKDEMNRVGKQTNNGIMSQRTGGKQFKLFNSWCVSPQTFAVIMEKMDEKNYPKAFAEKVRSPINYDAYQEHLASRGFFND